MKSALSSRATWLIFAFTHSIFLIKDFVQKKAKCAWIYVHGIRAINQSIDLSDVKPKGHMQGKKEKMSGD